MLKLFYIATFYFLIKYPKPKIECKKLILLPAQHNNNNNNWIKACKEPTRNVKGTYLITFEGEIQINETTYTNAKEMLKKRPSSASSRTLNITGHQEVLSLLYLHRLNIENIRHINEVKSKLYAGPAISGFVSIVIRIIYFGLTRWHQIKTPTLT